MKIACPSCQAQFEVEAQHAGKVAPCPQCGAQMQIPVPQAAVAPHAEVHYSIPPDPGTCWPAGILSAVAVLVLILGIAGAVLLFLAGDAYAVIIGAGSFAVAAPTAALGVMTDRLHRLEWYTRRIEWYIRRDYEERHPQPPEEGK